MSVTTVGLDLAKNVFPVHGVDERGKERLRKQLRLLVSRYRPTQVSEHEKARAMVRDTEELGAHLEKAA